MHQTRHSKIKSLLQQEISTMISRHLKDPRVDQVILTSLELSPDARNLTANVTLLDCSGELYDERMAEALQGLSSAKSFMRRQLAKSLNLRYIPSIRFFEDIGVRNAARVDELLQSISQETSQVEP